MPTSGVADHGAPVHVTGGWFAAGAAQRHDGSLTLADGQLTVAAAEGGATCAADRARVSDFGDALTVEFPDGSAFVVASGQAATAALRSGLRGRARLVVRLQRRWQTVLAVVAGTVGLGAVLLLVVLPALTRPVAFMVPPSWPRLIDDQTLPILERTTLAPSALPEAEQERLAADLRTLVAGLQLDPERYRLLPRASETIGANAFAMPGGTIIVTDRIVRLLTPDELTAVLAHEIAHVERRHGLQQLLRKSALAIVLVLVGPDAGTIAELARGLPAVLLDSGYSRGFEREADLYACRALTRLGRDPEPLAAALVRLAAEHPETTGLPAWVSSHPDTDERIAKIRAYRRAYHHAADPAAD